MCVEGVEDFSDKALTLYAFDYQNLFLGGKPAGLRERVNRIQQFGMSSLQSQACQS